MPTSVEPVKDIFDIISCFTIDDPTASPVPWTILMTPGGTPASSQILASSKVPAGVNSEGFKTIVHPDANAGAIYHAANNNGKFQGSI